jgi:NAD-dependent dihydropyrimidine dehydrogenase PreA subunit
MALPRLFPKGLLGLTAALGLAIAPAPANSRQAPPPASASGSAAQWADQLARAMPHADRFTDRQGEPPAFSAYRVDPASGQETLIGYAFLTSDFPPEELGFNGPIQVLVGMDLEGTLTGVVVTRYNESLQRSLGDFLGRPGFQQQFAGKRITDAFQVKRDVDGITGATITVAAMSRGIRNAARRVAVGRGLGTVSPVAEAPPLDPVTITLEELARLSWTEMVLRHLVQPMLVLENGRASATLSLMYLHDEAMAELMVGPTILGAARERAGDLLGQRHMILIGADGATAGGLNLRRFSVVQDGDTVAIDDVLLFGPPREGILNAQVQYVRLLLVDSRIDMSRPLQYVLDLRPVGVFTADYPGRRSPATPSLAARLASSPGPTDRVAADSSSGTDGIASRSPGRPRDDSPAAVEARNDSSRTDEYEAPGREVAATVTLSGGVGPAGGARAGALDGAAGAPAFAGQALPAIDLSNLTFDDDEQETVLTRMLAGTSWARVIAIILLLALASAAFAAKRVRLRWVALAATLIILGGLHKNFLSVSHITSGIRVGPEVYFADLALLLLVAFTVITTLLWGRIFCGYLCPFGVLQDLLDRFVPARLRRALPPILHSRALYAKYGILALTLVPPLAGSGISIFQYFEPFGTVFFPSRSLLLWGIAIGILAASAVIPRFYCRYLCPLGAALAIGSLLSPFRIRRVEQCTVCKVCEQQCPTGAIRGARVDFKECVRCNVCEIKLIRKTGACRHDMDQIRPRLVTLSAAPARSRSR